MITFVHPMANSKSWDLWTVQQPQFKQWCLWVRNACKLTLEADGAPRDELGPCQPSWNTCSHVRTDWLQQRQGDRVLKFAHTVLTLVMRISSVSNSVRFGTEDEEPTRALPGRAETCSSQSLWSFIDRILFARQTAPRPSDSLLWRRPTTLVTSRADSAEEDER